ncbi:energy transducer TonB family protein [Mesorhizobium humile]|uniref:TonB family protein n=1 Tax=Mesorhizobium humile TaxID=3072313 RepID=A0ABU4YEH9_9HYPH|nr:MULTISPECIES: TonB family protein [unclassified Mesorhizobium]MDX8459779.1 TonB family protein [Mesorhizobium sp. VK2D]MDX8484490.1 TonB family protein [Mesorhizobium sp. VK2B]
MAWLAPGPPPWPATDLDLTSPYRARQVSPPDMQDINHTPDADSGLSAMPTESLQPRQPAGRRKWPLAIVASGLLHGAAAAAFLLAPAGTFDSLDAIQAEGSDQSGADAQGSALNDAASGAVDVTLVPDPQPVKRQAVQPTPPAEAPQPANQPVTPQPPAEAADEAASTPHILTTTTARPDDQSVPTGSEPAPAIEPQNAEASPAEPEQPPAPAAAPSTPAGSAGSGKPVETRGTETADGDTRDAPVVASKGKIKAAAGTALESRYSGEIQKRLARANRRVSKSVQAQARNNARVVFVVAADGSISDLQLAESSGSAELDQFALTLVRKQAPFPPIPPETGRSSWVFKARIGPF